MIKTSWVDPVTGQEFSYGWGFDVDESIQRKPVKDKKKQTRKPKPTNNLNTNIKQVIFNPPATIVYWTDGTKTVVKAQEDDWYDPEKGLAMAISKKAFGNQGNYYNKFHKWLQKYKEPEIEYPEIKSLIDFDGDAFQKILDDRLNYMRSIAEILMKANDD